MGVKSKIKNKITKILEQFGVLLTKYFIQETVVESVVIGFNKRMVFSFLWHLSVQFIIHALFLVHLFSYRTNSSVKKFITFLDGLKPRKSWKTLYLFCLQPSSRVHLTFCSTFNNLWPSTSRLWSLHAIS